MLCEMGDSIRKENGRVLMMGNFNVNTEQINVKDISIKWVHQ